VFFVFSEWGRSPIYRRWEVRGLGCEGVVEETASTIHAEVVASNVHKVVLNVQNAATFMNPRLKLLKLHPFPPHNMQRWLLERFLKSVVVGLLGFESFRFSLFQFCNNSNNPPHIGKCLKNKERNKSWVS